MHKCNAYDMPTFQGLSNDYVLQKVVKMSNTSKSVEWNMVDWKSVEKAVFKLQKRIYRATKEGDICQTRKLQKTLIKGYSARLLTVRKITQDNKGKKTAGVDGVKSLSPKQRLILADNLALTGKSRPTRRVWIDKPGKAEKRPLGIPTINDRAAQMLAKLALEPEWEARFHGDSYGFRPGRSAHDAMTAIFLSINQSQKWVVEADIKGCFDNINHDFLLDKLNTFPSLRRQVKAWLKAGVMDGIFQETESGTPQGGTISPLLANIALDGIESIRIPSPRKYLPIKVIRYADDFVVMVNDKQDAITLKEKVIPEFLASLGLKLSSEKTKITHTSDGFDFLGFNVRQYKASKGNSAKLRTNKMKETKYLGFVTLIKPSKKALKKHLDKVRNIIKNNPKAPQTELINKLNPVIRGWCNYYKRVISKDVFNTAYFHTFNALMNWAFKRTGYTKKKKAFRKYFVYKNGSWNFQTVKEVVLIKHTSVKVGNRHVKVKQNRSPYDGDTLYWGQRMSKHPDIDLKVKTLLKNQDGKCRHCGLKFHSEDLMEVDHIVPKSQGGKDVYKNMQLLHRHCHDSKTATDGSYQKKQQKLIR